MAKSLATPSQRFIQFLTATTLSVAVLYFGREILIPMAMAVLFTFLIAPLVAWFERARLGLFSATRHTLQDRRSSVAAARGREGVDG